MIDTHTHLNFEVFEKDWKEVVKRAVNAGVSKMIVVGTDLYSSKKAVEMAEENDSLFASVGIHPHHAKQFKENDFLVLTENQLRELEKLAQNQNVVAIGEIGLDYHEYKNSNKYDDVSISEDLINVQKNIFDSQVRLAIQLNKPVIVHSREAKDGVLVELLKHESTPLGVFHCFEGSKKFAKKIIDSGFYISFTGNVTFDEGRSVVSKQVPLDKLLLETDSPFMLPNPLRDKKVNEGRFLRCEPENVKIIGQFHANLRGISEDVVFAKTSDNAQRLFGI
ncbi:TatD family hydrolase [Patescibacteria group bacterium]